jgi:hypothetical protein
MATKKVKKELEITDIETLVKSASGEVVQLPSFTESVPFIARVKRPSLLGLVKSNKIPNNLLVKTNELFIQDGAGFDTEDSNMMKDLCDVLETIAGETLVEPSYDDLKAAGVELTDEQLMALFNYSQRGVVALESFRTE